MYLFLITDAYSRKIVGYDLSASLSHDGAVEAFKQADKDRRRIAILSNREVRPLVHHSDRGIQYCCYGYTNLLSSKGVRISMTQDGNVYENALAERMNGILKDEYLLGERYSVLSQIF